LYYQPEKKKKKKNTNTIKPAGYFCVCLHDRKSGFPIVDL